MNLYDKEIIRGYEAIKQKAIAAYHKGNTSQSILWVERATNVANQLNWKYSDEQLDNLMDDLSAQMISPRESESKNKGKRVVFYDQYGKSFILALQYIYALVSYGYDILYILSDYVKANQETFIIDELSGMENMTVKVVSSKLTYQQRAEYIYRLTVEYAPEMIFLHVKAFSVFNLVLPSLPKNITKYYIDLQDHAFWIKNNNIDYVLPYRDWGATIDIEKRGFKETQVLKVPYYPIVGKTEFQGFPKETAGSVIIFTGGNYYKTIDLENTYWNLIVRLLAENPNAVILYAGKEKSDEQNVALHRFAKGNDIYKRLIPLGFRTDINEVFAHCDIYMGTTPMSGGLMCQYAAYNSKPILQYYGPDMAANNETEQVINYNGSTKISYTDITDFLCEAKRLIEDEAYRLHRGKELYDCLIRKEQFHQLLKQTIDTHKTQVQIQKQIINYKVFTNWWFYLEKRGISKSRDYLLSLLKRRKYFVMPLSSIWKIVNK